MRIPEIQIVTPPREQSSIPPVEKVDQYPAINKLQKYDLPKEQIPNSTKIKIPGLGENIDIKI